MFAINYPFLYGRTLCVSARNTARVEAEPTASLACLELSPSEPAVLPWPVPYLFLNSATPWVMEAKLLKRRRIVSTAFALSGISSGVNSSSLLVSLTNLGKSDFSGGEMPLSFKIVLQHVSINSFAVPMARLG